MDAATGQVMMRHNRKDRRGSEWQRDDWDDGEGESAAPPPAALDADWRRAVEARNAEIDEQRVNDYEAAMWQVIDAFYMGDDWAEWRAENWGRFDHAFWARYDPAQGDSL